MFCNIVICAYPLPPVFGRFFAIPASFVAAIGLPLRLFVPQAAEKSRPRHPRAPRRRMSSRMVRNSKIFGANAALASKSINSHGTLPLSSPSSELRGELSDRPSYGCCFSPLFHNIFICACPLPPVFGLFSPSLPLSLLRLGYLCACSLDR